MQATQFTAETWLPVVGYEGHYEVSDLGRVRSLDRVVVTKAGWSRRVQGRILRAIVSDPGYPFVNLGRDPYPHRVHALVTEAFIGPRPADAVVRHLNGDKLDNRLANLCYGTPSENGYDTVRHGNNRSANKTHCPQGHPYSGDNLRIIPSRPTARYCRACKNAWMRADRARKREAA